MPLQACPLPRCWLMTDVRLGDEVMAAALRLPPRSAIVVRSVALPPASGPQLVRALRYLSKARRHRLLWAGKSLPSGFDGRFGAGRRRDDRWLAAPVHDWREAVAARRLRVDAILVSPVHATRSHPGAATLGRSGFLRLSAVAGRPAVALGGMTEARYRQLRLNGARGWAAIDAWLPASRS